MAYTLSFVLFLFLVFGFGLDFYPGQLDYLFTPESLAFIFIPSFGFSIASCDYRKVKVYRLVFHSRKTINLNEAEITYYFLRTLGNSALFLGMIGSFGAIIGMLTNISDPNMIGPYMGFGLLTLFHATILKVFAYTAGYKVLFQTEIEPIVSTSKISDICIFGYPIITVLMMFIIMFALS
jgi:hypothetical protein